MEAVDPASSILLMGRIFAALAVFFLNVALTIIIVKQAQMDRSKKVLQLALLWLVPLIGALLIIYVFKGVVRVSEPSEQE